MRLNSTWCLPEATAEMIHATRRQNPIILPKPIHPPTADVIPTDFEIKFVRAEI